MTTFYISGPITDPDPVKLARNKQAFADAAQALRARGLTVVSPVELCPEDGKPWEWYMRRCIKAMMECDEVVYLPGFTESRGAMVEHGIACNLGMPGTSLAVQLSLAAL